MFVECSSRHAGGLRQPVKPGGGETVPVEKMLCSGDYLVFGIHVHSVKRWFYTINPD